MPAVAPTMLLLLTSAAQAWEVNHNSEGDPLHWPTGHVEYWINPENSQGVSAERIRFMTDAASGAWSRVTGVTLSFDYLGTTAVSTADYTDDKNVIYFEDEWPAEWDPSFLALTFTWSVEGGEIIAFDMAINEDDFDWSAGGAQADNDLMNMLTHEIGHGIGLSHSQVIDATMYYQASRGEEGKRVLSHDDEEGARYLYGDLLRASAGCAAAPQAGAGLWALAGLGLAISLRSRRQRADAGARGR
ncbi:MAG: matrixin family metalloprotease [Deltaproteobacteria bacterium]|nr:matrixin family metalloprotease [Deltaproteobacteria bacterium]